MDTPWKTNTSALSPCMITYFGSVVYVYIVVQSPEVNFTLAITRYEIGRMYPHENDQ
ncbi:hypothetical protein CY34DRAFT_800009 [Suillus luteus UH-Slu-Lm8-n1]|uniref:Uncharacterized protein n=1 Tax=Suillus luteus UH-Slu-Lm8-n1 TaxID=930992 RepID=A0A0D0BUZ9_9AGAM|nr:hypothetical protein CY34DRAFT_800009 [Suillus luteus UH-Slu-Lm8-n1]